MHPVFKDDLLQKRFDQTGYVLFSSLLEIADVDALTHLFLKFQTQYSGPFHTTHFSTDIFYKRQVHDTIVALVYPKAIPYLKDVQPLFGNLMIKNADPVNFMWLHADWAYVDEREFSSVAIWIPLVDVDANNGCLGIIEGSHKVTNAIRGPGIKQSSGLERDKKWEKRYGKLIPMKAGDAIIYNHSLLHYSPPNKTKVTRPALNLSLTPAIAPRLHYCLPEGSSEIELYGVADSNFYIRYNNYQRPETGTLIKTLPPDSVKYIDNRMDWFWKDRILNKIKGWI